MTDKEQKPLDMSLYMTTKQVQALTGLSHEAVRKVGLSGMLPSTVRSAGRGQSALYLREEVLEAFSKGLFPRALGKRGTSKKRSPYKKKELRAEHVGVDMAKTHSADAMGYAIVSSQQTKPRLIPTASQETYYFTPRKPANRQRHEQEFDYHGQPPNRRISQQNSLDEWAARLREVLVHPPEFLRFYPGVIRTIVEGIMKDLGL